jgi:molybdopterin synthase catalytic subunit
MPRQVRFARVTDATIAIEDAVLAVESDTAGAVVTFAGVVRNHDGGREVSWLNYTAHPDAERVIREVAGAVAERHPSVELAVEHRVGELRVGDLALACAVSSAHRAEAFAACADLVDTVKATVPIWKEQGFADGTTEWVAALG